MSAAVVEREIIATLPAWDVELRAHAVLKPGSEIVAYRIHRHTQPEIDSGASPYVIRFELDGRQYGCPLAVFQARTQIICEERESGAIAV